MSRMMTITSSDALAGVCPAIVISKNLSRQVYGAANGSRTDSPVIRVKAIRLARRPRQCRLSGRVRPPNEHMQAETAASNQEQQGRFNQKGGGGGACHTDAAELRRKHNGAQQVDGEGRRISQRAYALLAEHVEQPLGRADASARELTDGEHHDHRITVVKPRPE